MDIKLLITDLDDTLISDKAGITDRVFDAIAKVKEKGIKATIATGRMHSSAFPFAKKLELEEPIISYNGALIKRIDTDEIILHTPVIYDEAIKVLEFAKEMGKFIQYYSTDEYYVYERCAKSDYYGMRTGHKAVEVNQELTKALDFNPTKLLMICEKDDAEKIYNLAMDKFEGGLNITRSSETYIEFNNVEASKGNACKMLAEYYGFGLNNMMSIGNGGNDVDMLKRCGIGVAVANAVPEAKESADYVSLSQEQDGASYAIERFLLNR